MKLHLPTALRTALFAVLALSASSVTYADDIWTTPITSDNNPRVLQGYHEIAISNKQGDGIRLSSGDLLEINGIESWFQINNNAGSGIYNDGGVIGIRDSESWLVISDNLSAITLLSGSIELTGNDSWCEFTGNSHRAIFLGGESAAGKVYKRSFTAKDNFSLNFSNNRHSVDDMEDEEYGYTVAGANVDAGGAIFCEDGEMRFESNDRVTFSGNYVRSDEIGTCAGGAIYVTGDMTFENNGEVTFRSNSILSGPGGAGAYGGAIYSSGSIVFKGNGDKISFSSNRATGDISGETRGGAIYSSGEMVFEGNDDLSFYQNRVSGTDIGKGGAICVTSDASFIDNQDISFSGNYVDGAAVSRGGAIFVSGSDLKMNRNENVSFSSNCAAWADYSDGGAIYCGDNSSVEICDNSKVSFTGNSGDRGSAIFNEQSTVSICGNDEVAFSKNGQYGVYNAAESILDISHNDRVVFAWNEDGTIWNAGRLSLQGNNEVVFRANSGMESLHSEGGSVLLSAAPGGSITIYDSIYTSSNTAVELNSSYTARDGHTQVEATGSIIFSGESAAVDYWTLLMQRDLGSAFDANVSFKSVIGKAATLHGGSLVVKEKAVLKAAGLTVKTSAATPGGTKVILQNGILESNVTMQSGTTLQVSGRSSLTGTLTMQSGSGLDLTLDKNVDTPLTLTGTMVQKGKLSINIQGAKVGEFALLTSSKKFDTAKWTSGNVTVKGASFSDLEWVGNVLYLTVAAPTYFTWKNGAGNGIWNSVSENWYDSGTKSAYAFASGMGCRFTDSNAGTVTLRGNLAPEKVLVDSSKNYTFSGTGKLTGSMSLTKQGTGTLNISTANTYTGGTTVKAGTLSAKNVKALGTGTVTLTGGTLQLNSLAVANAVNVNGTSTIKGSTKYNGKLTLTSGTLSGDKINVVSGKNAYLKSGTIKNALGGSGHVYKQGTGTVTLSGTNNWTGNTYVQGGTLVISGSTTLRGTTRTSAGSKLDIRRAVTLGNLYLGGGTLALKPDNILTVTGTLTLANATKLALSGVTASSHIIIKYGKLSNTSKKSLSQFFGLTSAYTVTNKSGRLTIAKSGSKKGVVDVIAAPEAAVSANALGQGTWGTARAARLFDHTVRDHAQAQSVALDKNRSVWFAAMSGFSHVDDAVDTNIYGGAVGMQFNGTMGGNVGLAIGQTYGHVSPAGASRVQQQTQHAALYGTKMLYTSATDSVSLTGTASYGTTDADHEGYDWTQHSAVLGVRGTWEHKLDKATAVYGFAGLEYLATDSEAGSGSIQALQGAIGAGISHTEGRLTLHADASFTPDMVRNAPSGTVSTGRLGFELSAGASYRISDQWSVNAGYTYHNEKRADSHEAYIGARCTF